MSLHAGRSRSTDRSWWILAVAVCVLASAVVGAGGTDSSPNLPADDREDTLLVIEGPPNGTAHYRIVVDGTVEPVDGSDATVEPGEASDGRVAGTVNGSHADAYRISGTVTGLAVAGNVTLLVDGHAVDPANLSDGWAVAFEDCSTVTASGDFASGYGFSTVVFPVGGPDGDFVGYEEQAVNEEFGFANGTARLRAGTTLPENVSEIAVFRSVFLYERPVDAEVDPLLVESEVVARAGEPPVRVENLAHGPCREATMEQLANRTKASVADATATGQRP